MSFAPRVDRLALGNSEDPDIGPAHLGHPTPVGICIGHRFLNGVFGRGNVTRGKRHGRRGLARVSIEELVELTGNLSPTADAVRTRHASYRRAKTRSGYRLGVLGGVDLAIAINADLVLDDVERAVADFAGALLCRHGVPWQRGELSSGARQRESLTKQDTVAAVGAWDSTRLQRVS